MFRMHAHSNDRQGAQPDVQNRMIVILMEQAYDVGRLCVKIAGRDAGATCVVVDTIDAHTVLVDGATRRRKCNTCHLEALPNVLSLKKGASHSDVEKEFKKLNLPVLNTKPKKKSEKIMKKEAAESAAPTEEKEAKKQKSKKAK